MIKITVELLPFGFEENKRTLGIMKIWNTVTGTKAKGNYQFSISKNGQPDHMEKGVYKWISKKKIGIMGFII